jgi:hypothetical protein
MLLAIVVAMPVVVVGNFKKIECARNNCGWSVTKAKALGACAEADRLWLQLPKPIFYFCTVSTTHCLKY